MSDLSQQYASNSATTRRNVPPPPSTVKNFLSLFCLRVQSSAHSASCAECTTTACCDGDIFGENENTIDSPRHGGLAFYDCRFNHLERIDERRSANQFPRAPTKQRIAETDKIRCTGLGCQYRNGGGAIPSRPLVELRKTEFGRLHFLPSPSQYADWIQREAIRSAASRSLLPWTIRCYNPMPLAQPRLETM